MNDEAANQAKTAKKAETQDHFEPSVTELSTQDRNGTGALNVLKSVLASLIGVQSGKNRERDFTKGKPEEFILTGILVVTAVMLAMFVLVKVVISSSTP